MASSFTGKGLAPLAVTVVLDWYLGKYGLHRVGINIRPGDAPSLQVAEELGVCEEELQQCYLYINRA